MVVKERIVVDLLFNEVNTCVKTVKEWFVSKGYKKITSRNPDRWSTSVILDIARGGLMSKTTIQAHFKSHGGGNSIMIEFLGSNDGSGLSGKPGSAAPDPKDKPYEALAMELSRFVKSTWKRGSGPGLTEMPTPAPQPTTMYQTSTPSYRSPLLSGSQQSQEQSYPSYDAQQQYNYQEPAQTGYDASAGYTQEAQQTTSEPAYQEPQPVVEAPTPEPVAAPPTEGGISDDEAARLEAELAQQEVAPPVVETPEVRVGPVPSEELPTPKPITFDTPQITTPVKERPIVSEPPVPTPPEAEVPAPPQAEIPVPEPIPAPVVEPAVEPAPVTPEPVVAPVVEPTPAPVAAPMEAVCPGCGKKTKPKWKTCPYCEYDLSGTKSAPPVEPAPAAEPQPVVDAAPPQVEQPSVTVEQQPQTAGNVEATCPTCPTCGQPPTWIADYNRYYCYSCQIYL